MPAFAPLESELDPLSPPSFDTDGVGREAPVDVAPAAVAESWLFAFVLVEGPLCTAAVRCGLEVEAGGGCQAIEEEIWPLMMMTPFLSMCEPSPAAQHSLFEGPQQ